MTDQPNDQNHDEDLVFLRDYVQAATGQTVPEEWPQASRRRLQESLASQTKENWLMSVLRSIGQRKLRWAMAAGVLALILGAVAAFGPRFGGAGGDGAAYAAVVQKIRAAHTMTCTEIIQMPTGLADQMKNMKGIQDKMKGMSDQQAKDRMKDMPDQMKGIVKRMKEMPLPTNLSETRAQVMFRAPSSMRIEMNLGFMQTTMIMDTLQKKMMTLMPLLKKGIVANTSSFQGNQDKFNLLDRLRSLPDRASEILEKKQLDGHMVQGFRANEEGGAKITVWADTTTGDPVRAEIEMESLMKGMHAVLTDFKFDVPLPDSLFSFTPPPGYTVETVQMDLSPASEKDLLGFLRLWVTHPKHKDGLFPPSLSMMDLMKGYEAIAPPIKDRMNMSEGVKRIAPVTRVMLFVQQMKPENDWHYTGQGVKFGDAGAPVCWWKPDGSKTYRVVAGDLNVVDLELASLPAGGKPTLPAHH